MAMEIIEQATQSPALPPGWVPEMAPGAAPGAAPTSTDAAPGQDEMTARLRKMLSNGHLPVGSLR